MAKVSKAASDAAARVGLAYSANAGKSFRDDLPPLPEIKRSSSFSHVCEGLLAGRRLVLFQSSYTIHTGQGVIPVSHTVYACDAPQWPLTHLTPRNVLGRLVFRLGRRPDLVLENDRFNLRYKINGSDEDFTIALLSPDMQAFMLSNAAVRWHIYPGRVCMVYGGTLKSSRIGASLARLSQFWMLVPGELEAW